ncbi:hypothetical protein CEP53_014308 [Fusarium sp. AF-6]|nr:hypothetical protein CEP53_014308 [Fusarium sp. AF-6]
MDKYMSIAQDRIINLQVEAKGVRQTLPKYEKQLGELDLALKNAREQHEKDMVELRAVLKNAQEENEKLSNDFKDFKKTTFTQFGAVILGFKELTKFGKWVETKFEMIFSRLGSQGKESGGGDVNKGDTRELEN